MALRRHLALGRYPEVSLLQAWAARDYAALAALHERLGGPWAVYRFLMQTHGELDGLTGRQAWERGRADAARGAAERIG